jgi:hypothetical protein
MGYPGFAPGPPPLWKDSFIAFKRAQPHDGILTRLDQYPIDPIANACFQGFLIFAIKRYSLIFGICNLD